MSRPFMLIFLGAILAGSAYPTGQPQEAAPAAVLVTDPPGDPTWSVSGTDSPVAPPTPQIDLLEVWLGPETKDTVEFGVRLARFDFVSYDERQFIGREIAMMFEVGGNHFRILTVEHRTCEGEPDTETLEVGELGFPTPQNAHLQIGSTADGPWRTFKCLAREIDRTAGTIRFEVPREQLTDSDGGILRPGLSISGFHVTTLHTDRILPFFGVDAPATASDRAPDEGVGPAYEVRLGNIGTGDVALSSPRPFRFSNGEATTLGYEIFLDNFGKENRTFLVDAATNQSGWDVYVTPRVDVPAGGSTRFPAILSMEFTHRHGESATALITARALDDSTVTTTLPIGVHWADIAQLSGHHPVLHFHALGQAVSDGPQGWGSGWMNAEPKDPDPHATDPPVGPSSSGVNPGSSVAYRWQFPLDPPMKIGLSFDGTRQGQFTCTVTNPMLQDLPGAVMTYALYYRLVGKSDVLLVEGRSEPRTVRAGASTEFMTLLDVPSDVERFPPADGGSITAIVDLRAESAAPDPTTKPLLDLPTCTTVLPLHEYHDVIDSSLQEVSSIRLTAVGNQELETAAGHPATFGILLTSLLSDPQEVRLSAIGVNHEWAHWEGPTDVVVGPEGTLSLKLQVTPPEDAVAGNRAEVFAIAENKDSPERVGLLRLRVTVLEQPLPPAAESSVGANETPGLSLAVLVLVIWAAAIVRRRF